MYMEIGRKIYYDKVSGNVVLDTQEQSGMVFPTTVDMDVENYLALSQRNRDSFDVVELKFGAHYQDFVNSRSYRVNPKTKELEFSSPDSSVDETKPPVFIKPLTMQLEEQSKLLEEQAELLAELKANQGTADKLQFDISEEQQKLIAQLKTKNSLLSIQNGANAERTEFLEELIAEIAMLLY